MIPVESISSATVGNLMYYVSIVGVLLFVATIIRLKVPFFRKAFIPASLIAGFIGLLLSPNFLNVIPKDIITSMSRLPTHLIVPVFACMFLGRKKQSGSGAMAKDVTASVLWTWAASFMQFAIPCLLVALVFGPMMGISDQFGAIFECGFAGGHGTASAMASMFTEQLGWADGADLAMTTATIGLLSGIFGGVALINYAVRKKWTKELTEPAAAAEVQEVFKEGERKPTSYGTINSDVIEPFAFHLAVIGIAILIGRAIVYYLGKVVPFSLPLFPFCMIGGWILNALLQRTSLADLLDRSTFARIQGMCLDILIVGAMASIKVPVVLAYWLPLLVTSAVILVTLVMWMFFVCPKIFSQDWFELAITHYGVKTGVAAVGYMLLRTADPEVKTEAGSMYALGTPFTSAFIGGGLVTSAIPLLIDAQGALVTGLIFTGGFLAIFAVLRLFFWNKNARPEQR